MRIGAAVQEVARVEADLLVAPLHEGERPPRGLAGRADWYLCGFISRLIIAGRVSGAAGETTLVATQGKLAAPRLLVLGVGARGGLRFEDAAGHLRRAAEVAQGLRVASVAIEVPATEARVGLRPVLGALGEAFAGALPGGGGELQILAAGEQESERWRTAIREAFPRGLIRGGAARPRA